MRARLERDFGAPKQLRIVHRLVRHDISRGPGQARSDAWWKAHEPAPTWFRCGYRFITDELASKGLRASRNRVNRLCTVQRIWSVHSRKRGLSRKPGPPVHDDLVVRRLGAERPNQLWFTDITEHPTAEGKLYLCAVKDNAKTASDD